MSSVFNSDVVKSVDLACIEFRSGEKETVDFLRFHESGWLSFYHDNGSCETRVFVPRERVLKVSYPEPVLGGEDED